MKKEQIKLMADRFLGWKLPITFSPDGGISFDGKSQPIGTNLFTATEAEEMVRYMTLGLIKEEDKKN